MDKMNYLIVCPVRCGSSWLNHVLETHYNLYNVGEKLCKIAPGVMEEGMQKDLMGMQNKKGLQYMGDQFYKVIKESSKEYRENLSKLHNLDREIRSLSREEQIKHCVDNGPFVAKFTCWDLYEDDQHGYGVGFNYKELLEKWAPLTTIFLYRKNFVEHFLSFLAYHQTGIGNASSQFMQYKRPNLKYDDYYINYHKLHMEIMLKCYREHKFDHTVAYEDLFNMKELCGIPLKQYEGQFTFKLNKYTREEKDEVIRRTGYSENYELH